MVHNIRQAVCWLAGGLDNDAILIKSQRTRFQPDGTVKIVRQALYCGILKLLHQFSRSCKANPH